MLTRALHLRSQSPQQQSCRSADRPSDAADLTPVLGTQSPRCAGSVNSISHGTAATCGLEHRQCDRRPDLAADARLRQRHRKTSAAHIACRRDDALAASSAKALTSRLRIEIELRRQSPRTSQAGLRELRTAQVAESSARDSASASRIPSRDPSKEDRVALAPEIRRHRLCHIVQHPNHAHHRRGINSLAARFVVERDVAAGDGRSECRASFGDAVNGCRKLRHDLRLLRIAKVQAVRRRHRSRTSAGYFAGGFGHRMHRA